MDENQQGVQLIESEEDKKKKAGQAQPGSAFAAGTSPTGAKPAAAAPSAPSGTQQARAAQQAGPTKGTGFTGVGRYLQANVGSRLGEKVAGRVAQVGQQAATRLGRAVSQFQEQLGTKPQEPGQQGTGLYGQLTAQEQASRAALQRISSGGQAEISPEEQAAYAAIASGRTQAPTGLQDIGDIQAQAELAGKLAAGTQTAKGRTGLLKQVVGRGPRQYTAGQSALDALLLGQAGGELAAARRASSGLGSRLETQQRLAEEQARQFGTETQRAKESITGERSSFISDLLAKGEAQRALYEKQQADFIAKAKEELASGKPISREVAKAIFGPDVDRISTMGFSRQELANLLETGELATLEKSLTPEQAAQIEALKRLGSERGIYASPEELSKLAGKTATGAAARDVGFKFDPTGVYSQKQAEFEKQKNIIDKVLEEFKTTTKPIAPESEWGPTSNSYGIRVRPTGYAAFAKNIEDYLYGKEKEWNDPYIKRGRSARQQTADLDAISMLETADPFLKQEAPYWVSKEMKPSYDALRQAIEKIKELGLTGERVQIAPVETEEDIMREKLTKTPPVKK